MVTIINDLRNLFQRGEVHIRLIFVNVAVFLAFSLVQIVLMLFNISITDWLQWLEMPASLSQFLRQPWTIINAVAVLVWSAFLIFFLSSTPKGGIFSGGDLWWFALPLCLQHFPAFYALCRLHVYGRCFSSGFGHSDCCCL